MDDGVKLDLFSLFLVRAGVRLLLLCCLLFLFGDLLICQSQDVLKPFCQLRELLIRLGNFFLKSEFGLNLRLQRLSGLLELRLKDLPHCAPPVLGNLDYRSTFRGACWCLPRRLLTISTRLEAFCTALRELLIVHAVVTVICEVIITTEF